MKEWSDYVSVGQAEGYRGIKGESGVIYVHFYDEDPLETGECTVVVFQQGMEPKTYKTEMRTVKEHKHIVTIHVD